MVAGTAIALAVVNLAIVGPVWDDPDVPETGARELTVLVLNLDATNHEHDAVADMIRERQPDLFAAVELTPTWARELEGVLAPYSSRLLEPRDTSWGLGLYSRRELSDAEVVFLKAPSSRCSWPRSKADRGRSDSPCFIRKFPALRTTQRGTRGCSASPARRSKRSAREWSSAT